MYNISEVMKMIDKWKDTVIFCVFGALYVPVGGGKSAHKNRAYHGFVINDDDAVKDYFFSDGRVMRAEGGCLFYLPRGSSYFVKDVRRGGCHAINFEADIEDEPFCLRPKGRDKLRRSFKIACDEWMRQSPARSAAAMRAIYDSIYQLCKAQKEQTYMPSDRLGMIAPAVEELEHNFTSKELTVAHLAKLCGVSEVYLRKIFEKKLGVSPKEYMISLRMEYAKQLLSSGEVGVAEAAQMCGYAEPCHFSREFKKRFGVSPKNYK